jgi:hypothetical protein
MTIERLTLALVVAAAAVPRRAAESPLKSRHRDRVFGMAMFSIAAGCQCKSSIMLQATSGNEWKQCRESNLLVVGCMAAVLDYDVEGRCHCARHPPEVFAHVTSEYGGVGEGDHAEIVDSGKYSRHICNDGAVVAACRTVLPSPP